MNLLKMNFIQDHIIRFLQNQTCATICCINEEGNPYCFSCYYVFNQASGLLYYKSNPEAHHSVLLKRNPMISGSILPDSLSKVKSIGVQLMGELLDPEDPMTKDAYLHYHKKHPIALAIKGEVFTISIDSIKMTDSSRIFGKKSTWKRPELDKDIIAIENEQL